MSKFRTGTRVVVIGESNEIRKGVIKSVWEDVGMAIVNMDDGNLEKVQFPRMGIEVEDKVQENQEVKTESQEGVKVITKDMFIEALKYVTGPEGMMGDKLREVDPMSFIIKSTAVFIVGMEMVNKLYDDKEKIELTREQLLDVIKNNTTPSEIAKTTGDKMSKDSVLPISLLSMLVLAKLIKVLFDEADNA